VLGLQYKLRSGLIRAEKGQRKKANQGWHRDRKENPISAPSIHVGALVGAGHSGPYSQHNADPLFMNSALMVRIGL
jgi:hypothetical protein